MHDRRHHASTPERVPLVACILLTAWAIFRIVSAYPSISLAYDEPAHIACGMEWLDKGTFQLEPLHPPLARIAAALGPYLAGARLPEVKLVTDAKGSWFDIYPAGNEILYTDNQYRRNLGLARMGQLPFLLVGVWLVFSWTRRLYGPWCGAVAVFMYTTLPAILAFAGLAYVDYALSVFLPLTLFILVRWLELPDWKRAAAFGAAGGLAVLSNLSALFFTPICGMAILCAWIWKERKDNHWPAYFKTIPVVLALSLVIIWAGYRFSLTPLNRAFAKPSASVEQIASPLRPLARLAIRMNPPVPAPDFFRGILASWMQNKKSPPSYALGEVRRGGFWYFYWLDLGLKTPLPFLVLAVGGVVLSLTSGDWRIMAPALSALAVLLVSMIVKVDFGVRHILFIYPLLTVAAAGVLPRLWRIPQNRLTSLLAVALLSWQLVSSIAAHPDYIAYFNFMAGKHPGDRLLFGCDLDCGQDVGKLAGVLRSRGVSHFSQQVWTSADLTRLGLPSFSPLEAYQPAKGWIAISVLYLRSGHGIFDGSAVDGYAWLNSYPPVEYVGKTIRLYYIP